jgi:hypothetical protein
MAPDCPRPGERVKVRAPGHGPPRRRRRGCRVAARAEREGEAGPLRRGPPFGRFRVRGRDRAPAAARRARRARRARIRRRVRAAHGAPRILGGGGRRRPRPPAGPASAGGAPRSSPPTGPVAASRSGSGRGAASGSPVAPPTSAAGPASPVGCGGGPASRFGMTGSPGAVATRAKGTVKVSTSPHSSGELLGLVPGVSWVAGSCGNVSRHEPSPCPIITPRPIAANPAASRPSAANGIRIS